MFATRSDAKLAILPVLGTTIISACLSTLWDLSCASGLGGRDRVQSAASLFQLINIETALKKPNRPSSLPNLPEIVRGNQLKNSKT